MINVIRWILFPFSLIYQFTVWVRNIFYDKGIFNSRHFSIPNIVIGNLAVGGAGKSPMTEYLIRLLGTKFRLATLSRGYGRKSKGFLFVNTYSTTEQVGDEPLQFKTKYPEITVSVCEDRCKGIENLQSCSDIVLLDDAYQHRRLQPGLSILLFDFESLFYPILMLPTGNFRDIFSSTKRADIIVITKCPDIISLEQKNKIENKIVKHTLKPIFYAKIGYNQAIGVRGRISEGNFRDMDVILFCGIANPKPLIKHLESKNNRVHPIIFNDHHNFSENDYEKIRKKFNDQKSKRKIILTTEKDFQRIDQHAFDNMPLYVLPIEISFIEKQKEFDQLIMSYLS